MSTTHPLLPSLLMMVKPRERTDQLRKQGRETASLREDFMFSTCRVALLLSPLLILPCMVQHAGCLYPFLLGHHHQPNCLVGHCLGVCTGVEQTPESSLPRWDHEASCWIRYLKFLPGTSASSSAFPIPVPYTPSVSVVAPHLLCHSKRGWVSLQICGNNAMLECSSVF